jgi:flagellar motor protein MotB
MSEADTSEIGHHVEEDENYFISMTDMMIGILFVFIILLMVFAMNLRQQTDTSEETIERLKQVAATAEQVKQEVQALQRQVSTEIASVSAAAAVKQDLLTELQERLEVAGLKVSIDVANGVLRLNEDAINFASDRSELTGVAAANVQRLASVLATTLPRYLPEGGTREAYLETVFIEGHTDKSGTAQRNWTLSTERAVNTFWGLLTAEDVLGGLRNRQVQPVLSAAGYADTRPVPGIDANDFDRQRRIDLRFVMDTDNAGRLRGVLSLTQQIETELEELQQAVDRVDVQ